jgi:hypothetical protein
MVCRPRPGALLIHTENPEEEAMADTGDWRRRLPARTARRGWLHDHLLTIVLGGMFLVSWVGQFVAQMVEVGQDAEEHGQSFLWSDFWPQFLSATFENWQSEFLQLFSFVALTAVLIHRNSSESADGDDEIKAMLEELMARTEPSDAHV